MQSLKSVQQSRVGIDRALSLGAAARNLGESAMCSAGAPFLRNDEFNRPAGQNTLPVHLDASCGQLSDNPVFAHINRENLERPYLSIAPPGLRGQGDFNGVGRHMMPQGLYQDDMRGNFTRTYSTPNDAQPHNNVRSNSQDVIFQRVERPFDFSHDATRSTRY